MNSSILLFTVASQMSTLILKSFKIWKIFAAWNVLFQQWQLTRLYRCQNATISLRYRRTCNGAVLLMYSGVVLKEPVGWE